MRLPRPTTRRLMVLVAVVGACLWLSVASTECLWVGGFPLQVDLRSRAGRTIAAVAVETCQRGQDARFFLAHPDSPEFNPVGVPWINGQPFEVWIHCTGRSRGLRELAYHQREALVLRVQFADGSSQLVSAAIPDGRVRRRITVVTP